MWKLVLFFCLNILLCTISSTFFPIPVLDCWKWRQVYYFLYGVKLCVFFVFFFHVSPHFLLGESTNVIPATTSSAVMLLALGWVSTKEAGRVQLWYICICYLWQIRFRKAMMGNFQIVHLLLLHIAFSFQLGMSQSQSESLSTVSFLRSIHMFKRKKKSTKSSKV